MPAAAKGNASVLEMGNCMSRCHDDEKFLYKRRHTAMLQEKMQEGAWLSAGSWAAKHNDHPGLRSFSEWRTSVLNWGSPGQVVCPNQKDL